MSPDSGSLLRTMITEFTMKEYAFGFMQCLDIIYSKPLSGWPF